MYCNMCVYILLSVWLLYGVLCILTGMVCMATVSFANYSAASVED